PKIGGNGLNLTRAALDATCKYPWLQVPGAPGPAKYGGYAEDADAFGWVREGAPGRRRCMEAQLMDWADDVAYSVHDVEDGVLSGRISLRSLTSGDERAEIVRMAAKQFWGNGPADTTGLLEHAAAELVQWPVVASVFDYDGTFA